MRLNGFTCFLYFFLLCIFLLLFQKNPLLAIGVVIIVVGFKFARTTVNPMLRVARELHAINHHLAQLETITDLLEKVTTHLTTEKVKEVVTEPSMHTNTIPQELGEIEEQ